MEEEQRDDRVWEWEVIPPKNTDLSKAAKQNFDYFLILDFEATCDENRSKGFKPPEIIEFPTGK